MELASYENSALLSSNILIVDDSSLSRKITEKILKDHSFENIYFASNGKEALKKLEEGLVPTIIITDLFMPNMDGFELTKNLKGNPNFDDIPILIQTSASDPEDISKSFSTGASDVVLKPIHKDEFIARVFLHLENSIYRQRIKEELNQAAELQNSILPSKSQIDKILKSMDIKISSYFKPSSEVSGDFWGFEQISKTELAIYSVDLTGHGIAAAMNTLRTKSIIENSGGFINDTALFLRKLSKKLQTTLPTGQFATMFYGIINCDSDILSFSSAASPSAIILREDGKTEILQAKGLPLSVAPESASYDKHEVEFNKGDCIIMYSDALIESSSEFGEFFAENKICKILEI
jgi:sigma-B regulation protein RsbU (phosphoserine phosphatase)